VLNLMKSCVSFPFSNFTHLVFLTKGDSIGGASLYTYNLSKNLLLSGFTPLIIHGPSGDFSRLCASSSIETYEIRELINFSNFWGDLVLLLKLCMIVYASHPKAKIILNSSKASFFARIVCALLNRKNFHVVHGWPYTGKRRFCQKLRYYILEFVCELIGLFTSHKVFVCKYDKYKRPIPALNRLNLTKSPVIYNSVEDPLLTDSYLVDRNAKADLEQLHIYTVCRLDSQKDVLSLIHAVSEVNNVFLHIIGTGPLESDLRKLTISLNLSTRVKFYGFLPNAMIPTLVKRFDIFCLISNWEGFPLSTLEAMALAKPVIISDVGGAGEVFSISSSDIGFLIPPENSINAIVNALSCYCKCPSLIKAHSINSRQQYLLNFNIRKWYSDHLSCFSI